MFTGVFENLVLILYKNDIYERAGAPTLLCECSHVSELVRLSERGRGAIHTHTHTHGYFSSPRVQQVLVSYIRNTVG